MKTAIITDTNSGMTAGDAKDHDIILMPMPIIINGKEYTENVSLSSAQFYSMLAADAMIQTSQPSAGDVLELWDKTLKDFDEIVYIPMSGSLSGSCQSALLYAAEYGGKVQVVDNQRISVTQRQSALDAKAMADRGYTAAEIRETLEKTKAASHIYIMVDTLKYLRKGGRITPAAAAVAGVLNLKPVLQIQGGKLDAFAKCRGINNARRIMKKAVLDHIENEFGGLSGTKKGAWIGLAHTRNQAVAEDFLDDVAKEFPGFNIHMDELPLSIACHIGPGALALTCTQVLPEGCSY